MVDADLKPGDVAHDLVKRGKVQVIARAADSVEEHRTQADFDLATYKTHPLLDVTDDEPVFTCVYLPDEPATSFSGTYDFPRSRLARIPVEEANQDFGRVHDTIVVGVLEELFAVASGDAPKNTEYGTLQAILHGSAFDEDLVDEARELAKVDRVVGGGD